MRYAFLKRFDAVSKKETRSVGQVLGRLLFLLYAGVMLWLLFGQRFGSGTVSSAVAGNYNLNIVPLKTIKMYLAMLRRTTNQYLFVHALVNLAGNVILFVPLGFFLPNIWEKKRSPITVLLIVTIVIVLVELVQYVTLLGSCDVDDLLLNLLGAMVGYIIWRFTAKLRR